MTSRPAVPRAVKRRLWAESMGRCMNPACHSELIRDAVSVGQMAHIIPHSEDGTVSFENLVLLCPTCHTQIDSSRQESTGTTLREWKHNRNLQISNLFAQKYEAFDDLEASVSPLLRRNRTIFDAYGPTGSASIDPERHSLWEKFEPEIVSNNSRLDTMLMANRRLLPKSNVGFVDEFHAHCLEFIETRGDTPVSRGKLFPQGLLSVFDVEGDTSAPYNTYTSQCISPLQNFIVHLVDEGQFVRLQMTPNQVLTYRKGGELMTLNLEDGPRVRQIFWSGNFYTPKTSKILWGGWVFFLEWLHKNNIRYSFPDVQNLSEITLNGKHRVKLFYEYCLTISNLQEIELVEGLNVVNIHNWNDGPHTPKAARFAKQVKIQLFNQNQFFAYAHKNIK